MPKRILFCLNGRGFSGAEKMSMYFAHELAGEDIVEVLLNSDQMQNHEAYKNYRVHVIKNWQFCSKYNPLAYLYKSFLFLKLLITGSYDLVIFENKYLMQIGIPVARLFRKQIWIYVHFPIAGYELQRCFYRLADHIILCCHGLRKYFEPKKIYEPKISVLPNFVNDTDNKSDFNKSSELLITCIGHISEIKGQKEIIRLAEIFKDRPVRFLLIGKPNSENLNYYQECLDLIQSRGLSEKIDLISETQQVSKYLTATDIYIQPSLAEGLPLAVLEAMSSGLPVISYNIDGLADAVQHGVSGYLAEAGNFNELSNYVDRLINDQSLRQIQGLKAREIYYENFTFSRYQKKSELYKEMLSKTS